MFTDEPGAACRALFLIGRADEQVVFSEGLFSDRLQKSKKKKPSFAEGLVKLHKIIMNCRMVPGTGIEPVRPKSRDFKSLFLSIYKAVNICNI